MAEALTQIAGVLSQAGDADLASATARKAFQATSGIDDWGLRATTLAALLSNLRLFFEEDHKLTSRALESLLLSSAFGDHLAALPVPLLRRLLAYGYLCCVQWVRSGRGW